MYRATAMSALGPDHIPDVVDCFSGVRPARRNRLSFTAAWRKRSGQLYAERQLNGRVVILRHGIQAVAETYATMTAARGRIVQERRRSVSRQDAA